MRTILLISIGAVDGTIVQALKEDLKSIFEKSVEIGKGIPEPLDAYHVTRNQFLSTSILNAIAKETEYTNHEKVLGVADIDLYVPGLNFVFGEARQRVALISVIRLRQEFYGLPPDPHLFQRRVLIEAVHELGHTYGLGHCPNPQCVMFFSNTLTDTDRKGPEFCLKCKPQLPSRYPPK